MTGKEELSRGDALARVAVLEAELAELRKRICVPEGHVVVPLNFVKSFRSLAHNYSLQAVPPEYYDGMAGDAFKDAFARCGRDLRNLRAMLAAAPAPVERVEQEAVAWRVSHPLDGWKTYAIYPDWAEGDDGFQIQPLYTTPQPAAPAAQDVACLVEALRTVVGMLHHKATTPLERESIKIAEAAIAAQQSGGVK